MSPRAGLSALVLLSGCKAGIDHHTPLLHRAVPETCSTDRPPFMPNPPTNDAGTCGVNASCDCTSDSQCVGTSGGATLVNGRCGVSYTSCGLSEPTPCNRCSYDGCFADSDCTSESFGICNCRPPAYQESVWAPAPNTCDYGRNCRVDSDCASTGFPYCSPSTPPDTCPSVPAGSGYYCHTADDECVDNSDCPAGPAVQGREPDVGVCVYNTSAKHWTCAVDLHCVDGGS